jgi:hypothetical protein
MYLLIAAHAVSLDAGLVLTAGFAYRQSTRHALAGLLGKRDNDALGPADVR